jgi:hypothetical protein
MAINGALPRRSVCAPAAKTFGGVGADQDAVDDGRARAFPSLSIRPAFARDIRS